MKISINGNVVTISTNINYEMLKKATRNEPLIFTDSKDRPCYAVEAGGCGNISVAGATFAYANSDGNACMNIGIPNGFTPEEAKEYVLEALGKSLMVLREYETPANEALAQWINDRNGLIDDIVIG